MTPKEKWIHKILIEYYEHDITEALDLLGYDSMGDVFTAKQTQKFEDILYGMKE